MTPDSTPGEAVRQGRCPSCLGAGRVFNILADAEVDCPACGGSGQLDDVWRRLDSGDR